MSENRAIQHCVVVERPITIVVITLFRHGETLHRFYDIDAVSSIELVLLVSDLICRCVHYGQTVKDHVYGIQSSQIDNLGVCTSLDNIFGQQQHFRCPNCELHLDRKVIIENMDNRMNTEKQVLMERK